MKAVPYLPTPARLVLICALAVVGFVVGPVVEKVQSWRNRHLWEGERMPAETPACGVGHICCDDPSKPPIHDHFLAPWECPHCRDRGDRG